MPHNLGQLGPTDSFFGLSARVHQYPSFPSSSAGYPCSSRPCPPLGTREGNPVSEGKESDFGPSTRVGEPFYINVLPRPQEDWRLAAHHQPATTQFLHQAQTFSDGISLYGSSVLTDGLVGYFNRPEGCLSSCSYPHRSPGVPSVHLSGNNIPVSLPSLWSFHGPPGLHKGHQGDSCFPASTTCSPLHVPGRLAYFGSHQPRHTLGPTADCRSDSSTGFHHQYSEVLAHTFPTTNVSGSSTQFGHRQSDSYPRSVPSSTGLYSGFHGGFLPSGQDVASSSRNDGQLNRFGSLVQDAHATPSTTSSVSFSSLHGPNFQRSSSHSSNPQSASLVVGPGQFAQRCAIPLPLSFAYPHDRCLGAGLGSSLEGPISCRHLVSTAGSAAHQSSGTASSIQSPPVFRVLSLQSTGSGEDGQLHRSVLHQPPGGNPFSISLSRHVGSPQLVRPPSGLPSGHPSRREEEFLGRCTVTGQSRPNGMVPSSCGSQACFQHSRNSTCGPVCVPSESSTSHLLFSTQPSRGLEGRCSQFRLDGNSCLCFSTHLPAPAGAYEDRDGIVSSDSHRPLMAETVMVHTSVEPACSLPSQTPRASGSSLSAKVSDSASGPSLSSSVCLDAVKVSLRAAGLSEDATALAAKSRRESTRRTYDSRLLHFTKWCKERALDPHSASITAIGDFLLHLFNSGLQISTVKGYRSAIGAIHTGFQDGSTVSSSTPLSHLIRGMFLERPPTRKLVPSWDLGSVLSSLSRSPFEPASDSSLHNLTIKTAFLLAVATARRRSELHALTLEPGHIRWEPGGVRLIPHLQFLTKNQSINFSPPDIFVPSLTAFSSVAEDKWWCPVRALKYYIARTQPMRGDVKQLFITTIQPHRPASVTTIARWISEAIVSPVTDNRGSKSQAHETRSVSTSWAHLLGVSIPDIMKAACWKNPTTFTSCYLKDVVQAEGLVGRKVLQEVGRSSARGTRKATVPHT